jgi:alpha-ketoglutarate-dependent taurine dioxygenase
VIGKPYFAVIAGIESLPEGTWSEALRLLSLTLGSLVEQDERRTLVREVRDRGTRIGEGRTSRYSDSRSGGSFHTDGAELPLPAPDFFALGCVRSAAHGGATVLIDAREVLDHVRARSPAAARRLFEPYHFDRRGMGADGARTIQKPVFYYRDEILCVTYLREYIDAGHAHPGAPALDEDSRFALDCLDGALDGRTAVIARLTLEPGQLLLCNNTSLLHGRTEFTDAEDPSRNRLLLRTWIRATRTTSAGDVAHDAGPRA